MASFFGEVVFPSSRAFWDEDDENQSTNNVENQADFMVCWSKEKPVRIKTLVVLEGEMLINFSKQCLFQESDKACVVKDEKGTRVSVIYRINQEVYLCIINPKFDVKLAGKFIEKISDILLSAETTISVTCRHVSDFKSADTPDTVSFLRMLSTKNGEKFCKLKVTYLERPNIVFGVAAGVLSYADFMDLPSILYVLYTDSFALDSLAAEPLLKLFTAINCKPHNVTFSGQEFFNKGNLYM